MTRSAAASSSWNGSTANTIPPEHIRKLYSDDLKEYPSESSMLIGTEGSLLIPHNAPPQLLPEEKFSDVQRPKFPPRNHYHHFVDACLGGEKTESHFAQTGPMTEAIILGTVAIRVPGQKLAMGQPSPEGHQLPRSQPLPPTQIPPGVAPGSFLIRTSGTTSAGTCRRRRDRAPRHTSAPTSARRSSGWPGSRRTARCQGWQTERNRCS